MRQHHTIAVVTILPAGIGLKRFFALIAAATRQ